MTGWVRTGSFVDRLASVLVGVPVVGREIPTFSGNVPSLREACDLRAREICSLDHDQILILLSGGADSTLAAVAMSRAASSAGKEVVYAVTPSALLDLDSRTLDWLLSVKGAKVEVYDGEKLDAYSGGVVVTGVLGDELYDGWAGVMFNGLSDRIWEMTPSSLIAELSGLNESMALTARFMPVFAEMPYSMTAANMMHWLGFKYTWDRERHVFSVSTKLGPPGEKHLHFFESVHHQHWMTQDMLVRCGRTASTRKDVGIALIREYIGCEVAVPQKNAIMGEIVSGDPVLFNVLRIDSAGKIHRRYDRAGKLQSY